MDFDGTITTGDCLDAILRRHTQGWHEMLAKVARLEVGRVAALQEQIAKVRLPVAQVVAEFAAAAQPRPGFAEFLRWLAEAGGRAAVVSLGFRDGIATMWEREYLPPVEVFASELQALPGKTSGRPDGSLAAEGLRITVHQGFGDCELCGPGACKAPVVERLRRPGELVVAFGDGTADLCMARRADLTFARGSLARLCEAEGLAWRPLVDFVAARVELAAWLDERDG